MRRLKFSIARVDRHQSDVTLNDLVQQCNETVLTLLLTTRMERERMSQSSSSVLPHKILKYLTLDDNFPGSEPLLSTTSGELKLPGFDNDPASMACTQFKSRRSDVPFTILETPPRRVCQYVVHPVAVDVWCDDELERSNGQQLGTPKNSAPRGLEFLCVSVCECCENFTRLNGDEPKHETS